MILAGDVGGTKTALGLWRISSGSLRPVRRARLPSGGHAGLEDVIAEFMSPDERRALQAACFGIAGPVVDGVVKTTNLPWTIVAADLSARLGGIPVRLANDLEATAMGILHLPAASVEVLHAGGNAPAHGNVAVIAAGTGLGEAFLVWDGRRHFVVASEGGHATFAPSSDTEFALSKFLRREHGAHVSWERILSGPGIADLYDFLREQAAAPESARVARATAEGSDRAAAVTHGALEEGDPLCRRTLEFFAELYGAEAANLALKVLAAQGVYIAGGIAPRILPVLRDGSFLRGFAAKGRFRDFLLRIPVRVVLDPDTALLGAAHGAAGLLDEARIGAR